MENEGEGLLKGSKCGAASVSDSCRRGRSMCVCVRERDGESFCEMNLASGDPVVTTGLSRS